MELKPGYKQTEVGIIPNEWDVVSIGSLIFDYRGGASLRPSDFTSIGVKVLPKGGVGRTGWLNVEESEQKYCSPEYAAANFRNQVDKDYTIIVLRDLVPSGPSIGLIVQIRDQETYVLAQGVYGFKVNEKAVPGYLVHLSNTSWYRKLANSIMVGSTQVHITNTAYKKALIPLPPFSEQEAIAEALSDMDAFIEALEQLLAKKRQVKQGAMQELLTGKRRFPGFSDDWKVRKLGELCTAIMDGTHFTPKYVNDGIPFYSVENVTADDFKNTKFISLQEHNLLIKRCKPEKGDILMTRIGSLGDTKLIDWDVNASIYVSLALLKVNKQAINEKYLYAYTKSRKFVRDVELRSLVNAIPQKINMGDISGVPILVPSLKEQTAIAEILSDMDAEIAVLEGKLSKARQVKQGMMSELLTGRIRLVESGK